MRWWAAARCGGRVAAILALAATLLVATDATVATRTAAAVASADALTRAEQRLAARFARRGVAYPPRAVTLIGLKSEGRLELWADDGAGWRFMRSYLVQATSGRLGPKLRQGDKQVPEGIYQVSALNPRSRYHLALRLDYPNAFDRARGDEEGRASLGGDIMIHGDRVSVGCLPIGDASIEEVFALASTIGIENLTVVLAPADLRTIDARSAAAQVKRAPRWLGDLYAEIARTLASFPLAATTGSANPVRTLPPRRQTLAKPKCAPYDAVDCERRCGKGDVASCARAGVLFRDGRGVPRDTDRAWRFLTTACARGDAVGCGALGDLVVSDDGARRDTAHAARLARGACDAGDGHACALLASLCSDKLVYPSAAATCDRDEIDGLRQRAVAKLTSRCTGWGAYDCFTLATVYADDGDPDLALRFASASCRAGDPGGCDQLGLLRQRSGDPVAARTLYERACGAGYARACSRFGGTITTSAAPRAASGG